MGHPPVQPRQRSTVVLWALRVLGAVLLAATAVIHGFLWQQGYQDIDVIGPAFLANTVLGAVDALALLSTPLRWLRWVAAGGLVFAAGTLAALVLSTTVGLFGFYESTAAQLWWESFRVEAAAVVLLSALAVLVHRRLTR